MSAGKGFFCHTVGCLLLAACLDVCMHTHSERHVSVTFSSPEKFFFQVNGAPHSCSGQDSQAAGRQIYKVQDFDTKVSMKVQQENYERMIC